MQPHAVHGRVHQVANAREVANVFQNRQACKKWQQIGQHDGHRSGGTQHASLDAGKQRAVRVHVPGQHCHDDIENRQDAILTQFAHIENYPEESKKYSGQYHVTPDGMHGDVIHTARASQTLDEPHAPPAQKGSGRPHDALS